MKFKIFFATVLLLCLPALAEVLPPRPATAEEVNAGVDKIHPVTPSTLRLNPANTNISSFILQNMGGQNEYDNMRSASNAASSVAFGFSYTSPSSIDLWTAKGRGLGSNVWGGTINLPGGSAYLGNPYWQDLPASTYQSQGFYFGFGPEKSSMTNVYTHGFTNIWPNIDGAIQPYFQVVNANPYGGGAGILIRSGSTNPAQGQLLGQTDTGTNIYLDQFGLAILDLTGEPYGIYSNGVLTATGIEAQQVPSHNIIQSDPRADFYVSLNGQRSGDTYVGQIPLFAISHTNFAQHILAGFPLQVPNVWMPRNPNWRWALGVDEVQGTVFTTNSLLTTGNLLGMSTNRASYIFGRDFENPHEAMMNVNGDASFALDPTIYGNFGAWTWDVVNSYRFGIVITSGDYPHLGHASGTPFIISQYGQSDLHNVSALNPSKINELTINPDSTVTFAKGMIQNGNTFVPTISGNDGMIWNSNKVLYFVTATKTNLITDGR